MTSGRLPKKVNEHYFDLEGRTVYELKARQARLQVPLVTPH